MTNVRDNEILTQVGPGTPMGELMRQYWIPAAMSSELKADGDPMRLVLLGEKLIGFRDSAGRVGIMDHRCPHRGASIFSGGTKRTGSGVSITAGSLMWRGTVSIRPTCRRTWTSDKRSRPGLTKSPSVTGSSLSTWESARRRRPRCPPSNPR